jgi:hypothetical protein
MVIVMALNDHESTKLREQPTSVNFENSIHAIGFPDDRSAEQFSRCFVHRFHIRASMSPGANKILR